VRLLKNLTLNINGSRPIKEAIVTAGGVSTDEINPSTMESKLVKGLYFAEKLLTWMVIRAALTLPLHFPQVILQVSAADFA